MIRLAFSAQDIATTRQYFNIVAPKEAGAFFILRGTDSPLGIRFIASQPYFPELAEWDRQGEHLLQPGAKLLSAMISRSINENAGLLFVHSHPNPGHPTGFSSSDRYALESLAEVIPKLLDAPFCAAVSGPNGWVGTHYQSGKWRTIDRLTSAGRDFRILNPLGSSSPSEIDNRQEMALGKANRIIRSLDVALVGCGGLGSPLAETLVRLGVRKLILVDKDRLDTPSNVRRVFGSKTTHLDMDSPLPKVSVVADHCRSLGLDTEIVDVFGDIRRESVFVRALDTDIIFCATDSHSSRAVLDAAAYAFHLPLIDCGVRVGIRKNNILAGLVSEIRISAPGLACLWCRGVLSAENIRAENLPEIQKEQLKKDGYIVGGDGPEPSVIALTVLGAGMMASALLGMFSEDSDTLPDSYLFDGLLGDSLELPVDPKNKADCICHSRAGKGEAAALGLLPDEDIKSPAIMVTGQ